LVIYASLHIQCNIKYKIAEKNNNQVLIKNIQGSGKYLSPEIGTRYTYTQDMQGSVNYQDLRNMNQLHTQNIQGSANLSEIWKVLIHDRPLSWLATDTSIKSGRVKLE
jgi:hypothetical protein